MLFTDFNARLQILLPTICLLQIRMVYGGSMLRFTNSSTSVSAGYSQSVNLTKTTSASASAITSTFVDTSSYAIDAMNASSVNASGANSTSTLPSTISSMANSSTTQQWPACTEGNYPNDCLAYYTSANGLRQPVTSKAWNAIENAVPFSSAYDCQSALLSYSIASSAFEATAQQLVTYYSTVSSAGYVEYDTSYSTMYSLTILCDGLERVATGPNVTHTVYTSIQPYTWPGYTYTERSVSILTATFPEPSPTCKLDCEACDMLAQAAQYSMSSLAAASLPTTDVLMPAGCPGMNLAACNVGVYSAQLYYWPVTTVGGDICNKTGTMITPTPTGDGPNTFVVDGTITLTSPTVYVSFLNMGYSSHCGDSAYTWTGNTLMGFSATDIRTQRGFKGWGGDYSFNYADLPPNPVPSSAWFGQGGCSLSSSACMPIGVTDYGPILSLPSVFLHLSVFNPAWTAQCALGDADLFGVWDPPVACQPQTSVVGPSTPTVVTTSEQTTIATTAASPSSALTQPAAVTQATTSIASAGKVIGVPPTPASSGSPPATSGISVMTTMTMVSVPPQALVSGASNSAQQAADADPPANPDPQSSDTAASIGSYIAAGLGLARPSSSLTEPSIAVNAVSVLESALSTRLAQPAEADSGIILAVGGTTLTAFAATRSDGIVVDGTIYTSGQELIAGPRISTIAGDHKLLDGTSTFQVPQPSQAIEEVPGEPHGGSVVITVGGMNLNIGVAPSGKGVVVDGTTLMPGQTIMAGTEALTIDSNGNLVDSTSTITIPPAAITGSAVLVDIGGTAYTATRLSNNVLVIGGTTLTAGGSAKVHNAHTLSEAADGALLIDGTSTVSITTTRQEAATMLLTVDGTVHTAVEISHDVTKVDGEILMVGGSSIILGSHTFSAAANGFVVVDGTSTAFFPSAMAAALSSKSLPEVTITIGADAYLATELESGLVELAGMALSAGGQAVTVDGEIIGAIANGLVVNGTKTVSFDSNVISTSRGAGPVQTGTATASQASKPRSSLPKSTSAASKFSGPCVGSYIVGCLVLFAVL